MMPVIGIFGTTREEQRNEGQEMNAEVAWYNVIR